MRAKSAPFFTRYGLVILIATAIATPLLFIAARMAVRSNTNNVLDWLPPAYEETAQLKWFRQHFAGDGYVIVSWDGCRIGGDPEDPDSEPDDPRIEQLAQLLAPPMAEGAESSDGPGNPQGLAGNNNTTTDSGSNPNTASVSGSEQPSALAPDWCTGVITGRRLLTQFTSDPMNVPYDVAVDRLKGIVLGPDGRQTGVVMTISSKAVGKLRSILGHEKASLLAPRREGELFRMLRSCGIDPDTARLGGPAIDNVAIDEEGERTLARLASIACLVGFVLAGASLRSVRLTLIVFACGVLSAIASLAAIRLSGQTTDAILMSMPALVYVLAVSGAVHVVNYYRTEIEESGLLGAPERAVAHAWRPALFCATTTAFGLLSLYASELTPIRKFGIFSATGVMLTLIVLFTFLPAALTVWCGSKRRMGMKEQATKKPVVTDEMSERRSITGDRPLSIADRFIHWICAGLVRHHAWVVCACTICIAAIGWGLTRVNTTIDLMKLFDSQARVVRDYQWLESNVGRLVPMELVIRFDEGMLRREDEAAETKWQRLSLVERMQVVSAVEKEIAAKFGPKAGDVVGPSMSAVRFLPALPKQSGGVASVARRSAFNSKLRQSYNALLKSGYLRVDTDGAELWRVSLRLAAFKDVDYAKFTTDLRDVVEPALRRHNDKFYVAIAAHPELRDEFNTKRPKVSAVYTGVVPIVYKAQRALLDSLIESTIWSFVTITPLLMFVARSVRAGAVAMLPNALPILVVFGGMGWLGQAVDIGSMMSASIALGVAVDDTIHYLTWFREALKETGDRHKAILMAYQRCAAPTLQAAMISGLGLSVFAFSTFTPTKQFGYLMLTILVAGVVAELIMLPALLAGPLGRAFPVGTPKKKEPIPQSHHVGPGLHTARGRETYDVVTD